MNLWREGSIAPDLPVESMSIWLIRGPLFLDENRSPCFILIGGLASLDFSQGQIRPTGSIELPRASRDRIREKPNDRRHGTRPHARIKAAVDTNDVPLKT